MKHGNHEHGIIDNFSKGTGGGKSTHSHISIITGTHQHDLLSVAEGQLFNYQLPGGGLTNLPVSHILKGQLTGIKLSFTAIAL